MADRGRRAPGGVAARAASPGLRVAFRADDPATKEHVASLLNDVADFSLVDEANADILVIVMASPRALDAMAGARKTIVLVDRVHGEWAPEALRAGVQAILPLDVEAMTLAHAVRAVAAGLVVLHPSVARPEGRSSGAAFLPENDSLAAPLEPLTDRELQVLHLLADGLGNKAIARRLSISDHTVKFHLASIYSKLDAKSRAEALAQGIRFGLIHL